MFIYAWWDRFDLKNEKIIVYCRCGFVGSFLLVSVVNMERSGFVWWEGNIHDSGFIRMRKKWLVDQHSAESKALIVANFKLLATTS
jgi:hypothetical protein